ncbi:phosphoglycolate phosphatase [Halarchaeum sp. P4]|uniref:phosphoglycolate phosphatase n=1 Tax=Halarchaeum sp. P4 TaxID=3421639 RepID=UPI003EC12587
MVPPLAVDIDGTLTDGDGAVDPRVFAPLQEWEAPVVVATGKAFPYPVALAHFLRIERTVIAENGGISLVGDDLVVHGDRTGAQAVIDEYESRGYDLGWGELDLTNRWRETEVAVSRDRPLEPLEVIAAEQGLEVVDTGYAYHVKDPTMSKGRALRSVARRLDYDVTDFAAVGDSQNDAHMFEEVGVAYAVANADDHAREAADYVTEASYADGFLEAAEEIAAASE